MELSAQERTQFGKANKALRRQGLIPAEFYGRGTANRHLTVDLKAFQKVLRGAGENAILTLRLGEETLPALVHDVVRDYLSGDVAHVDFYRVRMDEKIRTRVPIEFVGEAPAVKELGGYLNKTMTEVEAEALPAHIPKSFVLSLGGLLEFHQSLYVRDLAVPEGVKVLVEPGAVVVSITPPAKEEEAPPAPADVSAVKVETEEKKAERETEKSKSATEEK
ncbi:MAG: 50S ribosomal protein L25 [Candidatus Liptonbacteria bacterium]|nr:50S ribosomal protein L25 [Candidatus Liptonbacteria bacterium]